MTPERWQQIELLFQSVAARPSAERAAFLERACAEDASLRAEVERLLSSHDDAGSFISAPAFEVAAEMMAAEGTQAMNDRTIGHYKILSLLGAGGMGEVYLAQDTSLGRKVALKLLVSYSSKDQDNVRRFQHEARAASALNHPNIAHIYEIGEADGANFIAMEYVEGQLLGARIGGQPLDAADLAQIGIQIADALDEAHAHGIIHRDIKSANIIITPRGLKVLDFGLAKQVKQKDALDPTPESEIATRVKTRPGLVMGTANYMSPEQALGREVDQRTDIWSLGVVLYEMATGRLPFTGESVTATIDRIAHAQPDAIARFNYEVPAELEVIVKKALRKNRDERYQTARDLLLDLKALKQDLDFAAQRERSFAPGTSSGSTLAAGGGQSRFVATSAAAATATAEVASLPTTSSSAEYLVAEIRRHKRGALLLFVAASIVVSVTALLLYKVLNRSAANPSLPFQNVKVSRLTNSGRVSHATISRDGKYVVYEVDEANGLAGLHLRQLATNTTLQIVAPANLDFSGTTFSRDGSLIYYVVGEEKLDDQTLYQVPTIGGTPRKVLSPVGAGPITFAPDGDRFAYVHIDQKQGNYSLMIADTDGTKAHPLISGKDLFLMPTSPAWSTDGKTIVCGAGTQSGGYYNQELYAVDAVSGAIKQLTSVKFSSIYRTSWLEDGSGLVFLGQEQGQDPERTQLWHVTYPGGAVRRITNDTHTHSETSLGLTANGRTIVTIDGDKVSNIWTLPASGDMSQAKRILAHAGEGGVSWAPDGKIVYASPSSGTEDIWLMDADGSNQRQLTSDTYRDQLPAVSHDGTYVVFSSMRPDNTPHLWRMDIDGTNLKQLTTSEDYNPSLTPDDRWIVYESWGSGGQPLLWKVAIDGGKPLQLTSYASSDPRVSPDGKSIASTYYDEQVNPKRWRNAVLSIDGGRPLKVFDRPQYQYQRVALTVDGRALLYVGALTSPSNLWLQPIDGSPPRQLTNFTTELFFHFALSPDGKWLAIARGEEPSDLILISDTR